MYVGPAAIAEAIEDNGALTKLDMSDNRLATRAAGEALGEMLNGNTTLLEFDVSKNEGFGGRDGTGFAQRICNGLECNEAISSINLLKNQIPKDWAQKLVKMMQAKENLTTLCGLRREETELDFSRQDLGAGDAVLIANDISDMGAISLVGMASNKLGRDGAITICDAFLCRYWVALSCMCSLWRCRVYS
jgi:hypothetical protein